MFNQLSHPGAFFINSERERDRERERERAFVCAHARACIRMREGREGEKEII